MIIRIVLDTNILISATLKERSTTREALDFVVDNCLLLASIETISEYTTKINHKKFKAVREEVKKEVFDSAFNTANFIPITEKITACRDERDDKFLELAVCGKADYLVSGDKDLLALNPFRGIPILSAVEFLERVKG